MYYLFFIGFENAKLSLIILFLKLEFAKFT